MRFSRIYRAKHQPFAWLLIWRHKYKSLAGVLGIAFTSLLIIFQLGFYDSLVESSSGIIKSLNAELMLVHADNVTVINLSSFPESRLSSLDYIPGVEETVPLRWTYAKWKLSGQRQTRLAVILGIEPISKSLVGVDFDEQSEDAILIPETILFDRTCRSEFGRVEKLLSKKSHVTGFINNRRVNIDGLVDIGPSFGYDCILVSSQQTYEAVIGNDHHPANPNQIEVGLIRVSPGYTVEQVARTIRERIQPDVQVLTKKDLVEFEKDYWLRSKPIGYVFGFGITMGFVIGTIILYQILYADIIANLEHYAVMLAIGYPMVYLRQVVASQALIMVALSYPLTIAAAAIGYRYLGVFTNLPFVLSLDKVVGTFGLVMAMSVLSTILALSHLNSTNPVDAFK